MRQKGTKFCGDRKVELKKSLELDRQILLKVLTKIGIQLFLFARTKVNTLSVGLILCFKRPFFQSNIQIKEILMKFCRQFSTIRHYSVEFSDLLWSFAAFYCHKWNTIRSNCIKLQIHSIPSNFMISQFPICIFQLILKFFQTLSKFSGVTLMIQKQN